MAIGIMLCARGADFDVDAFLENSPWPERFGGDVFYRGDPMKPPKGAAKKDSEFALHVSEISRFGNLGEQIPQAVDFLRDESSELDRLRMFPGVSVSDVVFSHCSEPESESVARRPPQLLTLAGRFGLTIEIPFYGNFDDDSPHQS